MPRERSVWTFLIIALLWLIIGAARASATIGRPARWVDVLFLLACGMIAGAFVARAKRAKRVATLPSTEIPGGPPIVPK